MTQLSLLPSLGAAIALLSVFPAAALVGGAPKANQSIARYVVMVVGSDKTFCSGVVIARDLILTAAQCIHPATSYKIVGFDARRTLNRHSPDDSETSVESSDFAASLEARREMWLATSSSGSPNDGRGSDLAIFPGIWTHSFYRCS